MRCGAGRPGKSLEPAPLLLPVRFAAFLLFYSYHGERERVCDWGVLQAPCGVLEPQLLAYLPFVKAYDDLAVYDGGRG